MMKNSEILSKNPVIFDESVLTTYCQKSKIQPYRQKQILHEIFKNQQIFFDDMTTLSKDLREQLKTALEILSLSQDVILEDRDTVKIGFKTHDGYVVESVLMFHWSKHVAGKLNRITQCISSQIGCPVGCVFCVTGKLGIKRNLTWDEIVSQILRANHYIKNKFGKKEDGSLYRVRNVVFMGMGEPLLNYNNVTKSLQYMLAQNKLSLSKRHITISTCGIISGIQKLIDDRIDVMLAISLHGPTQQLREELIPIAQTNKLKDLMHILQKYIQKTNNRIFYEYIMIRDVTDTPQIASQLADLLCGQLAHVNLIPYNQNPALSMKESKSQDIRKFKNILEKKGITVTTRDSLGREAKSACGQLGYEKVEKDNSAQ